MIATYATPHIHAVSPKYFRLDNCCRLLQIPDIQKRNVSVFQKMLWWTHQKLRASNPQTRLAVVQRLAFEADPKSVGLLILVLKDNDADVRCAAAKFF